jgi:hypothetical protein
MSVILPQKPTRISSSGTGTNLPENLISGDSGVFVNDLGDIANILFKINGNNAVIIDKFRRLGINVDTTLAYRLEIDDNRGECIKMWKNGDNPVFINNIEGDIGIDVNNRLENGVRLFGKLYMNDVEVLSTATKINYTNITELGSAENNKCVVLDSNKSFYGINELSVDNLTINKSLTMDMDSDRFSLNIKNSTGKCLKLFNDSLFQEFTLTDDGDLVMFNNTGAIDIIGNQSSNIQYPLQLTSTNNNNSSGVGIKFNTYNNSNIKRNMSSIETIIINNENNMENSIIKFNNMKDGQLFNTVTIRNDGYVICNTLLELSDMRKKEIVKNSDINQSLDKVNKIKTYDFYYKNDEKKIIHKGVMAQELHEVIPSAVNVSDTYTVSSKDLIGYLIDSIKSLSSSVEELKQKVKNLENKELYEQDIYYDCPLYF